MSEYYEFEQILENLDEELVLSFAGIILAVALVVLLVAVAGYIFQSIGLYTIAKRRGIANPWLAWLPWVGYYWIAGSIADQYQYVVNGAVKNRRTILLALSLAAIVVSSLVATMINGSFILTTGEVTMDQLTSLGTLETVLNLVASALEVAVFVFWQIALYDLYSSCKPKNNVLFLVLGILFGFLTPFFIFACRNKEEGMPPRREEPRYGYRPDPQQPYQPAAEPRVYKEPWENI